MSRPVIQMTGTSKAVLTIACTDVVQTFSNAQLASANGALPINCLVTAEGNNVRFSFGSDPTQGIDGSGAVGHVIYAGQSFLITNSRNIATFRFINAVNGSNAVIQVSMMYEIGG